MAQCTALALATERIESPPRIAPIYAQTVEEFAHGAAYITRSRRAAFQSASASRTASYVRMGVTPGKPLGDTRAFVENTAATRVSAGWRRSCWPTLRKADDRPRRRDRRRHGLCQWQPRPYGRVARVLPATKRDDPKFFIGDRIRTCVSDDLAEARAVLRRTMSHYAFLPYYRNYWKEAGYTEEMTAIESAIRRRPQRRGAALLDRPLARRRDLGRSRREGCAKASRPGARPASGRPWWCRCPPTATSTSALRQVMDAFT